MTPVIKRLTHRLEA
jgi:hypothetical protein